MDLILASTSPRRRELLSLLRVPFRIVAPDCPEELIPNCPVEVQVQALAREKAQSCSVHFPESLVLGSDTLLSLDGELLGKPADRPAAREMLCRMRGRVHSVHTGVAILQAATHCSLTGVECARVWMREYTEHELDAYLDSSDGMGKAGGYAIQGMGSSLIQKIEGDFTAIVGLPLLLVANLLARSGLPPGVDLMALYRTKPYPHWGRFVNSEK